jgi:hypothetical protein
MKRVNRILPWFIVAVLLAALLPGHPYIYFSILRWIVCGASLYAVFLTYRQKSSGSALIFIAVAVLFNPLLPIHLDRSAWKLIDIVVAGVFVYFEPMFDKQGINPKATEGS